MISPSGLQMLSIRKGDDETHEPDKKLQAWHLYNNINTKALTPNDDTRCVQDDRIH